MTKPSSFPRDTVLDTWRGISILMVIAHHLIFFHYPAIKYFAGSAQIGSMHLLLLLDRGLLGLAERAGPLGVKFFFVISGFIITKLMIEEERKRGSFNILHFYIRRFVRIIPPLAFYLGVLALFASLGLIVATNGELLHAIEFVCNTGAGCGWNTIHTWTLATEMQFYLLWPVLFLLTPRRYRLGLLSVILVGLTVCSGLGLLTTMGWLDNAISFICIGLGALVALSERVREFLTQNPFTFIGILVAVVGILVAIHQFDAARIAYREATPWVITTLIFTSYKFPRIVNAPFFKGISVIGLISYSLYLWQEVFLSSLDSYPMHSVLMWPILMIPFALFSYLCIEKPSIEFGKKLITLSRGEVPIDKIPGI